MKRYALLLLLPGCSGNSSSPDVERPPVTAADATTKAPDSTAAPIISYTADPRRQHIALYWKDATGRRIGSLGNLRAYVERQPARLLFAMNGGMFNPQFAPQGLYIEDYRTLAPLDTLTGRGNFYLKPNGVFFLRADGTAAIVPTAAFRPDGRIRYATQSGPMLVVDGAIHPAFRAGSANRQIRNGVGVLPDGRVLFAMSKAEINLYDFAEYFRGQGCRTALYLDGFVSRLYLPERNWVQTDGDFGVIIGVTQPQ